MIKTKISKTMSTEEYIQEVKIRSIDNVFNEAIKEAKQEELQLLQSEEYEKHIIELITKLADLESEISIMSELYLKHLSQTTLTIDEKVTEKKELTNLKRQYTKIKNELDSLLIKEKTLKNTLKNTTP